MEPIPNIESIAELLKAKENAISRKNLTILERQCVAAYEWGAGMISTEPTGLTSTRNLFDSGNVLSAEQDAIYDFWNLGLKQKQNSSANTNTGMFYWNVCSFY